MQSRQEVLRILNEEIGLIEAQNTKHGLTRWALLTALASISWLLMTQIKAGGFNIHIALSYLLALLLLWDFSAIILNLIFRFDTAKPKLIRFLSPLKFGFQRKSFIAAIMEFMLIFCLLFKLNLLIGAWIKLTLLVYYGFFTLISVIGLIVSFTSLPIAEKRDDKRIFSALFFLISITVYTLFFYSYLSQFNFKAINLNDAQIAFILFVLVYLAVHYITNFTADDPLLLSLIELRRSLNFGYIDPQNAYKQADILVYGRKVENIFQKRISDIISLFQQCNELIDKLGASFIKNNPSRAMSHEEDFKKLDRCLDLIRIKNENLTYFSSYILKIYPESSRDIHTEREKIVKYSVELKDRVANLKKQLVKEQKHYKKK